MFTLGLVNKSFITFKTVLIHTHKETLAWKFARKEDSIMNKSLVMPLVFSMEVFIAYQITQLLISMGHFQV